MADKRLDQVTKVPDMAYVPVIMSDGSIGQIAKADLATVVAERFMFGALTNSTDVDNIEGFGFYSAGGINNPSLPIGYGMLMCFQTKGYYNRIQIFFPTNTATYISFRIAIKGNSFGEWKKIAFTV